MKMRTNRAVVSNFVGGIWNYATSAKCSRFEGRASHNAVRRGNIPVGDLRNCRKRRRSEGWGI